MRIHLYPTFVDLRKTFDTVNREGLYKIMQKLGRPERFAEILRLLHDGMTVTDVKSSISGGCTSSHLCPQLPSINFSSSKLRSQRYLGRGHTKGHGPHRRRLRQIRPNHQHGGDGGCASTVTRRCLHRTSNQRKRGQLQFVDDFTYLGSNLFRNTKIHYEVSRQISKRRQVFDRFQNKVRNRHGLHISTKLKRYKAIILPTVLYGTETSTVYKKQVAGPDLGYAPPRQLQLHWSEHFVRMDDERLPKRILQKDVAVGSRRQAGQVRRHKGTLKTFLNHLQINPVNCEDLARNRPTWRWTAETGATTRKPTASPLPKPNMEPVNLNCTHLATPTLKQPRPAHAASGRSKEQSV
ncbi:hypothetical protein SprV_0602166300 [Sparganum proliferum]